MSNRRHKRRQIAAMRTRRLEQVGRAVVAMPWPAWDEGTTPVCVEWQIGDYATELRVSFRADPLPRGREIRHGLVFKRRHMTKRRTVEDVARMIYGRLQGALIRAVAKRRLAGYWAEQFDKSFHLAATQGSPP